MPLKLVCFIDQAFWAVTRDLLIKTTYWPPEIGGTYLYIYAFIPNVSPAEERACRRTCYLRTRQPCETSSLSLATHLPCSSACRGGSRIRFCVAMYDQPWFTQHPTTYCNVLPQPLSIWDFLIYINFGNSDGPCLNHPTPIRNTLQLIRRRYTSGPGQPSTIYYC